jgi:hypothetical protein
MLVGRWLVARSTWVTLPNTDSVAAEQGMAGAPAGLALLAKAATACSSTSAMTTTFPGSTRRS